MFTRRPRRASTLIALALCATATATPALAQSSSTTAPATAPASATPAPTKKTPPLTKLTDANGRPITLTDSTPESKEDEALEHYSAYAFGSVTDTNCQTVIDVYKSNLIPKAEQAKFPKNKAKYLELAHESIGTCQVSQGRYIDAEQSFRDALAQAEIWPGKDDSRYADLWLALSDSQTKQDHWTDAETSLARAAAIFQSRIDDYNKVLIKVTGESADNIRKAMQGDQRELSVALLGLAYTYLREDNIEKASQTIEQAYQQAVAGKLKAEYLSQMAEVGAHIAELTENSSEVAKWAARVDSTPPSPAASTPQPSPQPPAAASPQK
jgi:tetratricopeptide (TPR) repeat protein